MSQVGTYGMEGDLLGETIYYTPFLPQVYLFFFPHKNIFGTLKTNSFFLSTYTIVPCHTPQVTSNFKLQLYTFLFTPS